MIAGDVEARIRQLQSAAATAAETATVALERLERAEAVCKALLENLEDHPWLERNVNDDVLEALEAWYDARPS